METLQQKRVAATKVISVRHTGAHGEIGEVYHALYTWAQERNISTAGHGITIFLAPPNEFDPESALFEVCLPVTGDVTGDDKVTVKELPACIVAFATVKGPYHKIPAHYSEILAWLSAQGMETVAPPREVYIKHPDAQGRGDPSEFLTEIQFPINE